MKLIKFNKLLASAAASGFLGGLSSLGAASASAFDGFFGGFFGGFAAASPITAAASYKCC